MSKKVYNPISKKYHDVIQDTNRGYQTMKAGRFVKKEEFEKDGLNYVQRTSEVRDIDISQESWTWIYENIMYDDYEVAQQNGLYETEFGFHSIDCQKVSERFDVWKEEQEEFGETLEDYNDEFKETFNSLKKILNDNLDFTIYYEDN